ncbi:hypothetical protein [Dyadobacter tibetensis]|uniref:hypothetical protein n=1 Tax=Dyadobacter tibetensis TaxID=1211851 RepID=UPI000472F512|nr:hypothetical protein [Dyadobacter tibetensis]
MSTQSITPNLTLPSFLDSGQQIEGFKLWVSIPANDDTGVIIDNVLPGDEIYVYDASGIASFKKTSMKLVKAIVGIANAIAGDVLMVATEGAAAPFVGAWNTALKGIGDAVGDSDISHGRRDMFGQDPGTGDYGKNEGGLIVCMPESRGAIYASDSYHLADDSKSQGRKYQYYSQAIKDKNAFFPCPVPDGRMSGKATISGAVHVLAFDSNFQDNAGSYNVGLIVVRGLRPSGQSTDSVYSKLMGAGPAGGEGY